MKPLPQQLRERKAERIAEREADREGAIRAHKKALAKRKIHYQYRCLFKNELLTACSLTNAVRSTRDIEKVNCTKCLKSEVCQRVLATRNKFADLC